MDAIKLIASDMDHTLLTEKGEIPPNFDDYIPKLEKLGIDFVIASGRPLYTLYGLFPEMKDRMSFISDNGGIIIRKGEVIFKSLLERAAYRSMIKFTEEATPGVAILCALDAAFISEKYKKYENHLKTFYLKIKFVKDIEECVEEACKFTVYFPDKNSAEYYESAFKPRYGGDFSVTIGDTIWIDIMNKGIDKGKAMRVLAERLNIGCENMAAFGDTYNDIEMLQSVKHSYIVKNASEDMKKYANFTADSNDNFGVLKVLDTIIRNNGFL